MPDAQGASEVGSLGPAVPIQRARAGAGARRRASVAARTRESAAHADACVIGDIDLVEALRLGGISTALAAGDNDPAHFSRAVVRRVPFAPPRQTELLFERLMAYGGTQETPPVLYYQSDAALLLVSRYREELATRFRFVVAEADIVEASVDKAKFGALAERLGLPVPPSRVIRGGDRPSGFDDLCFPLIVKPVSHEHPSGLGTPAKAVPVATRAELEERWPAWRAAGARLLIQQLVTGPETAVESYHAYVDEAGEVVGEFTGGKVRTYPIDFGDSSLLTTTAAGDVVAAGRDAVRRLGLHGVVKLDYKRDPGGRLWLLEVNPRFTLWHHLGAVGGTNLAALVHADLTGRPRPPVKPVPPGLLWWHPLRDLHAAQECGDLRSWVRALARADVRSGMSLHDPLPFVRGVVWPGVKGRVTPRRRRHDG